MCLQELANVDFNIGWNTVLQGHMGSQCSYDNLEKPLDEQVFYSICLGIALS